MIKKEIGPYSAYAIAVKHGYVGTEEEWIAQYANLAETVQAAKHEIEIKGAETLASIPEEYSQLSESVDTIFNSLHKNLTAEMSEKVYSTANGWKLREDDTGLCVSDSNYKLTKFIVTAGDYVIITAAERFQFQNTDSVPSSGKGNIIGKPYNGTFAIAPENAKYVIVSSQKEINSNIKIGKIPEAIKNIADELYATKTISVKGGERHSSNDDQIPINIKRGELYTIELETDKSITGKAITFYEINEIDSSVERSIRNIKNVYTARIDIKRIGFFISSTEDINITVKIYRAESTYGKKKVAGAMPFITTSNGYNTGKILSIEENKLSVKTGRIFIYYPPFDGAYYELSIEQNKEYILSVGETLCIDKSGLINQQAIAFDDTVRIVPYGEILENYIPVFNVRYNNSTNKYHAFAYAPFANFVVKESENKYKEFKYDAYPYTVRNIGTGWEKRINILHISDTHASSSFSRDNMLEALNVGKDIYEDGYLNCIINTGDLVDGMTDKTTHLEQLKWIKEQSNSFNVPHLYQVGNHDSNDDKDTTTNVPTKEEIWSNLFDGIKTPLSYGDEGKSTYYYYDLTQNNKKIRIIMLDMLDHDDYITNVSTYKCHYTAVYSQKQIDWLCNEALIVDDGTGIIICNHFPFAPNLSSGYSEEYPALNDAVFAQTATNAAHDGWMMIPEIVEAWQNRTAINKNYRDTKGNQNIIINADFSNVGTSAQFICYLCGHTHSKNAFWVEVEGGKHFNQRMLCEDSNGQTGKALNRAYKFNSTSGLNNAFSLLSVDMYERKIYRTAYGTYKKCSDPTVEKTMVFDY